MQAYNGDLELTGDACRRSESKSRDIVISEGEPYKQVLKRAVVFTSWAAAMATYCHLNTHGTRREQNQEVKHRAMAKYGGVYKYDSMYSCYS